MDHSPLPCTIKETRILDDVENLQELNRFDLNTMKGINEHGACKAQISGIPCSEPSLPLHKTMDTLWNGKIGNTGPIPDEDETHQYSVDKDVENGDILQTGIRRIGKTTSPFTKDLNLDSDKTHPVDLKTVKEGESINWKRRPIVNLKEHKQYAEFTNKALKPSSKHDGKEFAVAVLRTIYRPVLNIKRHYLQQSLENRKPDQNENRRFPDTPPLSKDARCKSSNIGHKQRLKPKQKNVYQRKSPPFGQNTNFSVRIVFLLLLVNETNAEDMQIKGDFVKNVNGNETTLRCYTSDPSLLNGDKSWASWTCGNESIHQYPLSIGNTTYDICSAPACRVNCSERFCDLILYETSYVTCYCSGSKSKKIKEMESVTFDLKLGSWTNWSICYKTSDGRVQNKTRSCESKPYSNQNCSEVKLTDYQNCTFEEQSKKNQTGELGTPIIIGIVIAVFVVFAVIIVVCCLIKRRKGKGPPRA